MIKRIGVAFLLAVALGTMGLPTTAPAQQAVRVCVPVYNPVNGSMSCVDGWLPALLASLSTTVTSIKNAPGAVGAISCYNPNSSVAYIQVFDQAAPSSVTLGTTAPNQSIGIPATGAIATGMLDIKTMNGLQVAATTTATGSTAPTTALNCNVTYN